MTSLLGLHGLSKSYGTQRLFKKLSFTIMQGDRIGLLGPNGSGKSTLLKILMHLEEPDEGLVSFRKGLQIGYASQTPEFKEEVIEKIVMEAGLQLPELSRKTHAHTLLSKAGFQDFTVHSKTLSGGWKKRLDLVRAMMEEPDLLLLDEPTNHLDLESILWLEEFLLREVSSFLVVSHDRLFLERVTNKIIELNRCYPEGLFISNGNLSHFLEHKVAFLEMQKEQERSLASLLRTEIEWLRRSPKARTTKSRARIEKAADWMETHADLKRRNQTTRIDLQFAGSDRQTRKLLWTKNLSKTLGGRPLFRGLDLILSPGSRLGVMGKNGSGKTTLLKILSGQIAPDLGNVKSAEKLRLVYFDQHREQLPLHLTLQEALCPHGDTINYRGHLMHINGWAKRFLFSPDRLKLPLGVLSGGERARILIAKLLLEPADLLFLDEPTNDLDIPTLEVIEESLEEFSGAVVLISHDRFLITRVCTELIGLNMDGQGSHDFFADYAQWEAAAFQQKGNVVPPSLPKSPPAPVEKKRNSYREERERELLEKMILETEKEMLNLQKELENASTAKTVELSHRLALLQERIDQSYERWNAL